MVSAKKYLFCVVCACNICNCYHPSKQLIYTHTHTIIFSFSSQCADPNQEMRENYIYDK